MKLAPFSIKNFSKPKESKLFLALLPTLKQKRTQQFTSLSLTFVTIAFFGLFAINPTINTITDLQKQLDDKTFVNTQLQNKIAHLTSLQTQYTQLQPSLAPVFAVVPKTSQIDIFIGQIHQIALTTHIQLNRVQTLPFQITPTTLTGTKYVAYAFAIEGQGDLASLETFITQLGDFNRLLSFDTVEYARASQVTHQYRLSIRGKTYFLPEGSL